MEKVLLGLAPPPETEGEDQQLDESPWERCYPEDPTKMEAHVREQMANRLKKHLVSCF